jgi:molybdopterin molybdotransferase
MNMPWTLARQTAREAAKPLDAVEVALAEGVGLALASAVRALASQPTCDTSAMDGYAVTGPGPWTVAGRVAAGDPVPDELLRSGEAFGVATGAPVPDGSDLVMPVEICSLEGALLREAADAQCQHAECQHPDNCAHRRGSRPAARPHPGAARQPGTTARHPSAAGQPGAARQPGTTARQPRTARQPGAAAQPGTTAHHPRTARQPGAARQPGTNAQQPSAARQPGTTARQPGKHIRRRSEDWSTGDELIPAGSLVTPAVLGLAAGAGHDTLLVHRRPRVAVIVTGDELLHSGPPHPGRVRDAIGPMLPGLLTRADLLATTHLRDDPSALADALTFDQADVLVTCGATSVGPADHLRRVLAELDAEILVSGVSCRPGHPMLLAVLPDGRCVVGLPGNPFAALAAVLTLLHPLLDTLGGHVVRSSTTAWLPDVGAHPRDTRLIPVTRTGAEAVPVGHDRPGSLWGAALADALAVVPPGHKGGEVELLTYAGQRPV